MKRGIVLIVVVLALIVVGCGGGSTQQGTSSKAAAPAAGATAAAPKTDTAGKAAAPASGQASLQLMGWSSSPAENDRLNQVIAKFNQANPNINAAFNPVPEYDTKLQTSLAGGAPPDVFYVDAFKINDLVKAGALATADNKVTDKDDFYPFATQAFTVGGQYYCPAKDFSTLALIINTDMFTAAGVQPPKTWEELRAAAQKLTVKDKNQVGMVLPNDMARFLAFVYQAGGSVLSEDNSKSTINSPEVKAALDFYTGLYKDGFARMPSDVNADWPGDAFAKGLTAMVVEGNWIVPFIKDKAPNMKWQAVELPAGPKGKATLAYTVCYAVPAKAKNADASWTLVNYLTGKQGMKEWTDLGLAMPTRKSLTADWVAKFPESRAFAAGADYAKPWQFTSGFQDVLDNINNNMKDVMQGRKTSDQAIKEADQVITQVLSRNK